jgi:hypothetical protein
MKTNLILQELEQLADRLGWQIRYEKGDFDNGYCRIDDNRLIIIQKNTSTTERVNYISQVLAQENLEGIFLLPQVRKIIDKHLVD